MKAYSSFVDFLIYKLKTKSGTSKFSTSVGLNLYNQRSVAMDTLRESCKGWASVKQRAKMMTQMKKQARTVIQPDLSKNIENCVAKWHVSEEYRTRMERFTRVHEKCVKAKKKPTKAEYEDALATVGTVIHIDNGVRKNTIATITNLDFSQAEKRCNVSLPYKKLFGIICHNNFFLCISTKSLTYMLGKRRVHRETCHTDCEHGAAQQDW